MELDFPYFCQVYCSPNTLRLVCPKNSFDESMFVLSKGNLFLLGKSFDLFLESLVPLLSSSSYSGEVPISWTKVSSL